MKHKEPVSGWLYWTSNAGQFGTDPEQRAMVTLIGPGLNLPEDAMHPFSEKDPTAMNTTVPGIDT